MYELLAGNDNFDEMMLPQPDSAHGVRIMLDKEEGRVRKPKPKPKPRPKPAPPMDSDDVDSPASDVTITGCCLSSDLPVPMPELEPTQQDAPSSPHPREPSRLWKALEQRREVKRQLNSNSIT